MTTGGRAAQQDLVFVMRARDEASPQMERVGDNVTGLQRRMGSLRRTLTTVGLAAGTFGLAAVGAARVMEDVRQRVTETGFALELLGPQIQQAFQEMRPAFQDIAEEAQTTENRVGEAFTIIARSSGGLVPRLQDVKGAFDLAAVSALSVAEAADAIGRSRIEGVSALREALGGSDVISRSAFRGATSLEEVFRIAAEEAEKARTPIGELQADLQRLKESAGETANAFLDEFAVSLEESFGPTLVSVLSGAASGAVVGGALAGPFGAVGGLIAGGILGGISSTMDEELQGTIQGALVGAAGGFVVGGPAGAALGAVGGAAGGFVIAGLREQLNTESVTGAISGSMAGALVGFSVGGPLGAALGIVAGAVAGSLIDKLRDEIEVQGIGATVSGTIAGALLGFAVGGPLGAVLGGVAGAVVGTLLDQLRDELSGATGEDVGIKGTIIGAITGALLGFAVGGPLGAVLGAVAGAIAGTFIDAFKEDIRKWFEENWTGFLLDLVRIASPLPIPGPGTGLPGTGGGPNPFSDDGSSGGGGGMSLVPDAGSQASSPTVIINNPQVDSDERERQLIREIKRALQDDSRRGLDPTAD